MPWRKTVCTTGLRIPRLRIIHSINDERIPFSDSEEMYNTMRANGSFSVSLIPIDSEGHFNSGFAFMLNVIPVARQPAAGVEWFLRNSVFFFNITRYTNSRWLLIFRNKTDKPDHEKTCFSFCSLLRCCFTDAAME